MSALPSSATPARVAQTYSLRLAAVATQTAGRDGRVSANEASANEFVKDAYVRLGVGRASASTLAKAGETAMLREAERASGGDGRVSAADAQLMSPVFLRAFEIMRAQDSGLSSALSGLELAKTIAKLAKGITYTSETDADYTMLHQASAPQSLDPANMKAAFKAAFEKGLEEDDRGVTLSQLKLRIKPADSHFLNEAKDEQGVLTAAQRASMRRVHELLQANLVSIAGKGSDGRSASAKLWLVTGDEGDSITGPMFFVGRAKDGSLVGLETMRVWT